MRKALRLLRPGSRRELARALAIIRPAAGEAKRQLHAEMTQQTPEHAEADQYGAGGGAPPAPPPSY
jgi:hypothetical protein